jgi:Mrp family chromosome partitioning ATPase
LAEYLAGQATAKKAITRTTSMHGLRIVWAGAALAEPGPLLRSPRFPEFLTGLERTQDWVILDTPPIGVGDDALVVSAHSDATLVVISHDMTTGPALEAGLSKLRRVRAHVLGVVLNRAPKVATDAYGYLLESPVRELAAPEAARTRGDRSSSMPAAGERSADDSAARGDI